MSGKKQKPSKQKEIEEKTIDQEIEEMEAKLAKQQKIKPTLVMEDGKILAKDSNSITVLKEGFYGSLEKGCMEIHPIEALYLMNIRNMTLVDNYSPVSFIKLAEISAKEPRLFARYNIFRDWRDRGIIIDFPWRMHLRDFGRSPTVKYPSKKLDLPSERKELLYFPEDTISIAEYSDDMKEFFEGLWFGQVGVYKQHHRDKIIKLDFIETLFLAKNGFEVRNSKTGDEISFIDMMESAKARRSDAEALFDVYEDWRNRGFILKTGFKFGTHFRLYFPGASPVRSTGDWLHSKHVIHVFPKDARMIMSEWARAVRVAHSVRKTFIMAIPGMKEEDYQERKDLIDFIGYHRKKNAVENPKEDSPKFAIACFTEDEEFGSIEMASALDKADKLGLRLIIAITDRETAVTHYLAKRISLPGSRNRYYEIEWEQP